MKVSLLLTFYHSKNRFEPHFLFDAVFSRFIGLLQLLDLSFCRLSGLAEALTVLLIFDFRHPFRIQNSNPAIGPAAYQKLLFKMHGRFAFLEDQPMTNSELATQLGTLIREERRITNQILELINLSLERRAYLELGFASMFDWLVKGFGYSNAAAYRRIEAARLLRAVPEAAAKLAAGELNLSLLARTQAAIKSQEKQLGQKVSLETKRHAVALVEGQSAEQAERTLLKIFPAFESTDARERRRVISAELTQHTLNFSAQMSADLARVKALLSHTFPFGATDAEAIAYALKFFLDKKDPLRKGDKRRKISEAAVTRGGETATRNEAESARIEVKSVRNDAETRENDLAAQNDTSAAEASCVKDRGHVRAKVPARVRRAVFQRDKGCCTFVDPLSGKVCGSEFQIELDHLVPWALGGDNRPSNLRLLCRVHNLLAAEKIYGKSTIDQYRRH
jgi:5-methylcytosine-specific restriction endonuclease McrA